MQPLNRVCLILGFVTGILLSSRPSHAQYTTDFQTNIISGVTSNWHGNYNIGSNTVFDLLQIVNGGILFSVVVHVGYGGSSNSAVISRSGSVWNTEGIYVGDVSGSGNSLVISNGGRVANEGRAFVGHHGSNGNSALISGSASLWSNTSDLVIGDTASGNSLVISNGGTVVNKLCSIGDTDANTNNSVLVTGSGSLWRTTGPLYMGNSGFSNSLVLSSGGVLVSAFCYFGNAGDSRSRVLVTDAGSTWSNQGDLFMGSPATGDLALIISNSGAVYSSNGYLGFYGSGSNNSLCVVDGGIWRSGGLYIGYLGPSNSVTVAGGFVFANNLIVGSGSPTCNNLLQIDAGSVVVTNAAGDAALEVRRGTFTQNGGTLQVDRFVMTNACAQFVHTGGTLIYGTAVLDPTRDDDGDGMPNGWEQSHGLDPLNAADANADADGDGQSNLAEYQAGTDPNNSASVFRITEIAPWDDDMLLSWTAVGGRWYVLQTTTGFNGSFSNDFVDLDTAWLAHGSGETNISVLHLGAATNGPAGFYRVRLVR